MQQHQLETEKMRAEKDAAYKKLQAEKAMARQQSETVINEKAEIIKGLTQKMLKHEAQILELQATLELKADIEEQLAMERAHSQQIDGQKQKLQSELENASSYIIELEEKFYKSQQTSLELLKQLKQVEFENEELIHEIETLKQYIIDLKSRIAVYIPVKNDQVDKRLAEYINNYPDRQKLKIMFMRESEGVYQFGSKRVIVRVDKDRINIRVGGGFLSIDEFLD